MKKLTVLFTLILSIGAFAADSFKLSQSTPSKYFEGGYVLSSKVEFADKLTTEKKKYFAEDILKESAKRMRRSLYIQGYSDVYSSINEADQLEAYENITSSEEMSSELKAKLLSYLKKYRENLVIMSHSLESSMYGGTGVTSFVVIFNAKTNRLLEAQYYSFEE